MDKIENLDGMVSLVKMDGMSAIPIFNCGQNSKDLVQVKINV